MYSGPADGRLEVSESRSNSTSSFLNTTVNDAVENHVACVLGVFFGVGCFFGANSNGCPLSAIALSSK